MRAAQKRFKRALAINSGQAHTGAGLRKGYWRQAGIDCSSHTCSPHRLHRPHRSDARCSRPGGTPTQETAFRIFDPGPAVRSTPVNPDIELSLIRHILLSHTLARDDNSKTQRAKESGMTFPRNVIPH
jgi:hypothetical protein